MKDTGTEISSYPESGSNLVEQIKYDETKQQTGLTQSNILIISCPTFELPHRRLSSAKMVQRPQRGAEPSLTTSNALSKIIASGENHRDHE
jgi:hypothetical protein